MQLIAALDRRAGYYDKIYEMEESDASVIAAFYHDTPIGLRHLERNAPYPHPKLSSRARALTDEAILARDDIAFNPNCTVDTTILPLPPLPPVTLSAYQSPDRPAK
jgi:hypothetical protein